MATIQKKISRGHTYWQIVESRRIGGKPRPVVLLHLGTAESLLRRLAEEPSRALKARVFQFGALAALWNVAQELELVDIIDRHVPKREQGLTCGQYMLLAGADSTVPAGDRRCGPFDGAKRPNEAGSRVEGLKRRFPAGHEGPGKEAIGRSGTVGRWLGFEGA